MIMLRDYMNKGVKYQYRYIDKSAFQGKLITNGQSGNVIDMVNQFSLYDWIISALNKAGATCCNDYSGVIPVPTESDVMLPANLFSSKAFTPVAKGHDDKLDLFAAIGVVMNDVCGKSLTFSNYKLNAKRLKEIFVSNSLVVPAKTTTFNGAFIMPNGAVSLDGIVAHYTNLVSACNAPFVDLIVDDTVGSLPIVEVTATGTRSDGTTNFTAADGFIVSFQLGNGAPYLLNSGNPIPSTGSISGGDQTALAAYGVKQFYGTTITSVVFEFDESTIEPITISYTPVEDYLGTAASGLEVSDEANTLNAPLLDTATYQNSSPGYMAYKVYGQRMSGHLFNNYNTGSGGDDGFTISVQYGSDPVYDLYGGAVVREDNLSAVAITAPDLAYLASIGLIPQGNSTYEYFDFEKNGGTSPNGTDPLLDDDVVFTITPVQDPGLPSEVTGTPLVLTFSQNP